MIPPPTTYPSSSFVTASLRLNFRIIARSRIFGSLQTERRWTLSQIFPLSSPRRCQDTRRLPRLHRTLWPFWSHLISTKHIWTLPTSSPNSLTSEFPCLESSTSPEQPTCAEAVMFDTESQSTAICSPQSTFGEQTVTSNRTSRQPASIGRSCTTPNEKEVDLSIPSTDFCDSTGARGRVYSFPANSPSLPQALSCGQLGPSSLLRCRSLHAWQLVSLPSQQNPSPCGTCERCFHRICPKPSFPRRLFGGHARSHPSDTRMVQAPRK